MRDQYSNVSVGQSLAPVVLTATSTGPAIDLTGYQSAVFAFNCGAIVAAGNFAPKLQEADASGGPYTDVAAGDLNGSLPAALAAATIYKLGYIGRKQFVRHVLTYVSGTSLAVSISVSLSGASRRPLP